MDQVLAASRQGPRERPNVSDSDHVSTVAPGGDNLASSDSVDPTSFREAWRQAAEDPNDHSVAAVLDGVVIGTVSLDLLDGMGQPGMPERTEAHIGYIFDPAYAGRGYATEAVTAMVAHAFDELGVRRITAGCFADNVASVRILEKLGMRREQHGVGDSWHATLGWLDGHTYGLLAHEWRERKATDSAMTTTGPHGHRQA
jgi:RimJ/RimL family protein N-acetyltransferase